MRIHTVSPLLFHIIPWIPSRIVFWLFLSFKVCGLEHLKKVHHQNVLFAANHANDLDPIVFQYALPFFSRFTPLYFVALAKEGYSKEDFGWRSLVYGGFFFRIMGAYPVYRGKRNFQLALQHHIHLLEHGKSVLIFPEGKESKDGTMGEGKPGVVYLARKTQTPIVPVHIEGTYKLSIKNFLLRRNKVTITFGEPVQLANIIHHDEENSEEFSEQARDIMRRIAALKGYRAEKASLGYKGAYVGN